MFLVYQIQIHFLAITVARPEAEIHISYYIAFRLEQVSIPRRIVFLAFLSSLERKLEKSDDSRTRVF